MPRPEITKRFGCYAHLKILLKTPHPNQKGNLVEKRLDKVPPQPLCVATTVSRRIHTWKFFHTHNSSRVSYHVKYQTLTIHQCTSTCMFLEHAPHTIRTDKNTPNIVGVSRQEHKLCIVFSVAVPRGGGDWRSTSSLLLAKISFISRPTLIRRRWII